DLHALVWDRRSLQGADHRARLLLSGVHQRLLRRESDARDPGLVGAQHGRPPRRDLPQSGRAERRADDLRRHARVARPLLPRQFRRRDDHRALRARPPHPRGRELAAFRPHVRLAPGGRDPRLCRRPAGALGAAAPTRLAGATRMKRLLPFTFPVILLLTWEAAARSGRGSPLLFPPPEQIGRELFLLFSKPESLLEAWVSLYRALGGFALAAVVGIVVGMLMGRSKLVAGLLDPLFSGTYAVPKLALFPIFIFVFGIGSLSKVALVFLECLYPIVIMSYHGARSVNRVLLWSAQNMGASRGDTLRRVVVPATAPYIFAGFRVAVPVAMIVVVITEMVSSADGLGYLVIYSLSSLRTDRMLAVVVAIALLGYLLDKAVVLARDRLIYWEKLDTY